MLIWVDGGEGALCVIKFLFYKCFVQIFRVFFVLFEYFCVGGDIFGDGG